jgi:hypothetical protein
VLHRARLGTRGYFSFIASDLTAIEGYITETKCEVSAISTSNLYLLPKKTIALIMADRFSTVTIAYPFKRQKHLSLCTEWLQNRSHRSWLKRATKFIFCKVTIRPVFSGTVPFTRCLSRKFLDIKRNAILSRSYASSVFWRNNDM